MQSFISDLDSKRFGFNVAKLSSFPISLSATLQSLKEYGVKLVIARVKSEQIELLNKLEDAGFRVKDSQLTYAYNLKKNKPKPVTHHNNLIVRDYEPRDLDSIVGVAEESFDGYGHYATDLRLDRKHCKDIYIDWATRSCLDRSVADKIIIAEFEQKLVGYLSFKLHKNERGHYGVGGMGAVSSKYRSQGIFSSIIANSLSWGIESKLDWQEHNVIAANFAVNSAFINCGFKTIDSFITLHGWLD